MSETKKIDSLATKLAAIGKEIGAIDKSGKNQLQNYNYIEYGVVAGRIRELFDKYHIIIIPSVDNVEADEITNKYGGKGYHFVLNMTFTLINGEDKDDREVATWAGEASDYGDKGINKAETAGTKYFLMRLFNVSEKGEDNDANTPEVAESSRPKTKLSEHELAKAQLRLGMCKDVEELGEAYKSLGVVGQDPAVIQYTNKLKLALAQKQGGK